MHVAGELALWLEAAFGLISAISVVLTAELLARYTETAARHRKVAQARLSSVSDTALAGPTLS